MSSIQTPPPRFRSPDDAERLRALLKSVPYDEPTLAGLMGGRTLEEVNRSGRAEALGRLRGESLPEVLARLFVLGVPVERAAAERALAGVSITDLTEIGLLEEKDDRVRASVFILPHEHFLLAFDRTETSSLQRVDVVLGMGEATRSLMTVALRQPVRSTLDLGTGSGALALAATGYSEWVTATDINPRAVAFTRFNADLNGSGSVETVEGNLFEAVRGRRFDRVLSNPPFVISPSTDHIYRDSGEDDDGLVQRIVREVPDYLEEGGYCQITCNWAHYSGQDWRDRIRQWGRGTGCDIWVLRSDTFGPSAYVDLWMDEDRPTDDAAARELRSSWLRFFEERGIEAVSSGLLMMHRVSGRPNWFRINRAPETMRGSCGSSIESGFLARDFLQRSGRPEEFEEARLLANPDLRYEPTLVPTPGGWTASGARIRLDRGLSHTAELSPQVAELLVRFDGKRTVGSLVTDFALAVGADPSAARDELLSVLRDLVEFGFLLPPR